MELRNDYSLDSLDAINNILQEGGTIDNTTNLIIGISLLVVGIIIYIGNSNYSSTNGKINYMNCNSNHCVLYVEYVHNYTVYTKEFILDKNYTCPPDNLVNITYETSNPNNCYIGSSNYSILTYLLMGTGLFFVVLWYFISIDMSDLGLGLGILPDFSSYTKTETPTGLYVVSKK